MSWALIAVGIVLLAMPSSSGVVRGWLRSNELARLNVHALVAGFVLLQLGLVLLASPYVFDAVGRNTPPVSVDSLDAHLAPGGPLVGWLAGFVATLITMRASIAAVRVFRTRQRVVQVVERSESTHVGGYRVAIGTSDELMAFSISGRSERIFVTSGLVDALTSAEFSAVVEHEAAHLRFRHGRYLVVVEIIDRCFGRLIQASTMSLRVDLERSADEYAAGSGQHARSSLTSALGCFLRAGDDARYDHNGIGMRIQALRGAPIRPGLSPRALAYLPVVVLTAIGVALGGDGISHASVLASAHLF